MTGGWRDEQIRMLERHSPEFRERHMETTHTGELVAVDTFFTGTLKGVAGSTCRRCSTATATTPGRDSTSKLPLTAVQILNNEVLPFFEKHRARITTVLSDNGREFCGRPDRHPYELFLQLEEIEHRTTKVQRPQSNGFIERFHRTLWKSTCASRVARSGTRPSTRCRRTSTPTWSSTIRSGRTRAAA